MAFNDHCRCRSLSKVVLHFSQRQFVNTWRRDWVDFIDICGLPMVISSSKVAVEAEKE